MNAFGTVGVNSAGQSGEAEFILVFNNVGVYVQVPTAPGSQHLACDIGAANGVEQGGSFGAAGNAIVVGAGDKGA